MLQMPTAAGIAFKTRFRLTGQHDRGIATGFAPSLTARPAPLHAPCTWGDCGIEEG
jgi:hypothetical protein